MTVTLDREDYITLAAWAENYGLANNRYSSIRELTERIELANDLDRHHVMVRWRDANARPVGGTGWDWPPLHTQTLLRFGAPWTYDEVLATVMAQTTNPVTIEVTQDRTGLVGWYDIDTFFDR